MTSPTDAVLAIHNAFRRDIEIIDSAALGAARGKPGLEATLERFRFLNEVLEWHAQGEDAVILPLLESVAPSVYTTYERDHRALDVAFDALCHAVSVRDPLETARATKAFRFHLELHLDKEDGHLYRIVRERIPVSDQARAMAEMAAHAPPDRFPEVVAWMFPLIGETDRVNMTRSWQMGMPPEAFAVAAQLIEQAVGDVAWPAMTHEIPELVGAR